MWGTPGTLLPPPPPLLSCLRVMLSVLFLWERQAQALPSWLAGASRPWAAGGDGTAISAAQPLPGCSHPDACGSICAPAHLPELFKASPGAVGR